MVTTQFKQLPLLEQELVLRKEQQVLLLQIHTLVEMYQNQLLQSQALLLVLALALLSGQVATP